MLNDTPKEFVSNALAAPIIASFLKDLGDDVSDGFPELGIGITQMLDEQLRKHLKLGRDDGGIYASRVASEAGGVRLPRRDSKRATSSSRTAARRSIRARHCEICRHSAAVGLPLTLDPLHHESDKSPARHASGVKLHLDLSPDYRF
jgi:hypothetical protein